MGERLGIGHAGESEEADACRARAGPEGLLFLVLVVTRKRSPGWKGKPVSQVAVHHGPPPSRRIVSLIPLLLAVLPLVIVMVLALMLAARFPSAYRGSWLLALAAFIVAAYVLIVLTNFARTWIRRVRMTVRQRRLAGLRGRLGALAKDPSAAIRADVVAEMLPRLRDVRDASLAYPEEEQAALRAALAEKGTVELVTQWRELRHKWDRVEAVSLLSWLRHPSAVPVLREALSQDDPDEAYAAAQALAEYDLAEAYEVLLDALDEGRLPRSRVVAVLEGSRMREAAPLLARRARSESRNMRFWVAFLLGRSASPDGLNALYQLANDPDPEVRANAAEALGAFSDIPVGTLRRLLEDEHWLVRSHAAKAVGSAQHRQLARDLVARLEDRNWWVRQDASLALASLGDAATPLLMEALDSTDRFVRNKAAERLVASGFVQTQIQFLERGPSEALGARKNLEALGRAGALRSLEEAAFTAPPMVAVAILEVLGEVGDELTVRALETLGGVRPPLQDAVSAATGRIAERAGR